MYFSDVARLSLCPWKVYGTFTTLSIQNGLVTKLMIVFVMLYSEMRISNKIVYLEPKFCALFVQKCECVVENNGVHY